MESPTMPHNKTQYHYHNFITHSYSVTKLTNSLQFGVFTFRDSNCPTTRIKSPVDRLKDSQNLSK